MTPTERAEKLFLKYWESRMVNPDDQRNWADPIDEEMRSLKKLKFIMRNKDLKR